MKLRKVTIKNFRCLVDVTVPIDDTTILVGENNSGKTAFLEALKIALPRNIAGRETPFNEYDYYMAKAGDPPQTSDGIVIEFWFQEDRSDEWPPTLTQALDEIIQTDPIDDLDFIGLRLSSKYDLAAQEMVSTWEFLAFDGQVLSGKGANRAHLATFLAYVRCFYLSSLRNPENEFSPRSPFWGQILRDLQISDAQKDHLAEELAKLNEELLKADPRLEQVRATLDKAQKIMELGASQRTAIQALPLKPWDLMSKAEVVLKSRGGDVHFPLNHHGQGIQSLAVLFLFQAYIDVLLKPMFQPETEAILTLEEPEAHLHPQAIRALAAKLNELTSQKIISTHSPYFFQEIPLTQIRMFRQNGSASNVLYVKRYFTATIPNTSELQTFCANHSPKFSYHAGNSTLSVRGKMDEETEYRKLMRIYASQREVHAVLRNLYQESQLYLSDEELADLESYVKRIRGEILFARGWLLCEGQSEYVLLKFFAELLGTPLDQAGISIIDFQNNGSPGVFVGLARTFDIPWLMICDHDDAKDGFVAQVKARGLTDAETAELVRPLPEDGMDFELFLVKNGFASQYEAILQETTRSSDPDATEWIIAKQALDKGKIIRQIVVKANGEYELRIREQGRLTSTMTEADSGFQSMFCEILVAELQTDKVRYINALITRLRANRADNSTVPHFFRDAINAIITKVI